MEGKALASTNEWRRSLEKKQKEGNREKMQTKQLCCRSASKQLL